MSEFWQQNAIEAEILRALNAAEAVIEAFTEVNEVGALTDDLLNEIGDLSQSEMTVESFSRAKVDRLRAVAKVLEPSIRSETQTWFVHDECDLSGGHEETVTSAQGTALIWLRSALCNLADRLAEIVAKQEARQLAKQLNL